MRRGAGAAVTGAVATLLITAITFLATTIPATRASRLNPAKVLQPD